MSYEYLGKPIEEPPSYEGRYLDGREGSYAIQAEWCRRVGGPVLEVGVGPNVLAVRLAEHGIDLVGIDIRPDLEPDVVAEASRLPVGDDAVRTAASFQTLEHIDPGEPLDRTIAELCRVAREFVLISVPRVRRPLRTWVLSGMLGRPWAPDSDHEWELGWGMSRRSLAERFARHGFAFVAWEAQGAHRYMAFRRDPFEDARSPGPVPDVSLVDLQAPSPFR